MNTETTAAIMVALAGDGIHPMLFGKPRAPRANPWGPPSKKPEHLRDDGDRARLAAAAERRARKAAFRERQARGCGGGTPTPGRADTSKTGGAG
jgi:hypothetical protein